MQAVFAGGGTYHAEYRVQTRDGRQHWVAVHGLATFEEAGSEITETNREMTGMIGTVQDITARKIQEATLRQSEKLAATGPPGRHHRPRDQQPARGCHQPHLSLQN